MMLTLHSTEQLLTELNTLGVHFVTGGSPTASTPALPPEELLAGLAQHPEARLRLALIPLLLHQPHLAAHIPPVAVRLPQPARNTLKLFYTAAMLLQRRHAARLQTLLGPHQSLPDLFSAELGLPATDNSQVQLKNLAARHQALTGLAANWLGTYTHAAERFLIRLEKEARWQP